MRAALVSDFGQLPGVGSDNPGRPPAPGRPLGRPMQLATRRSRTGPCFAVSLPKPIGR